MSDQQQGVFARSANMAATITAGTDPSPEEVVKFAKELYKLQVKALEKLDLTVEGDAGGKYQGGRNQSGGRSGYSKKPSGQSGSSSPSEKQIGFVRSLVSAIEDLGGKPEYTVKDAKASTFGEVKDDIIGALIEQRDDLK